MSTMAKLKSRVSGPDESGIHTLILLCPKCRHHEICVRIWKQPAGEVELTAHPVNGESFKERIWHFDADHDPGWTERLSITPSIDCTAQGWACGGWHGYITNGEVR